MDAVALERLASYVHFVALLPVFMEILISRNCAGISGKTQLLYSIIFTTKELLHVNYINSMVLMISYGTLICTFIFPKPRQKKQDDFRIRRLLLPCLVVALFFNEGFTLPQLSSAFAAYLEALAILPQIYLISATRRFQPLVYYQVTVLTLYELFRIFNLAYLYYRSRFGCLDRIATAGIVLRMMFFVDFFATHLMFVKKIEES